MASFKDAACRNSQDRDSCDVVRLKASKMLTLDGLTQEGKGVSTNSLLKLATRHHIRNRDCLALPLTLSYFFMFCTVVMLHEEIGMTFIRESELRDQCDGLFGEVEDIDGLWDSLSSDGMLGTLFTQEDIYGNELSKGGTADDKWGDWGRFGVYNQIQAAVRIEQSRKNVKIYGLPYQCNTNITCDLCSKNSGFQPVADSEIPEGYVVNTQYDCGPNVSMFPGGRRLEEKSDSGLNASTASRSLALAMPFVVSELPKGLSQDKDQFRIWLYPGESLDQMAERLQYFRDRRWIDQDTTEIRVQMYFLNAEIEQAVMEQLEVTFYMTQAGGVYYQRSPQAIFFDTWPSNASMLADGIWFILLLVTSVWRLSLFYSHLMSGGICKHVTSLHTVLETVSLCVGWFCCAVFYGMRTLRNQMSDKVELVRARGWDLNSSESDEKLLIDMFDAAGRAASSMVTLRFLFANYSLVLMIRVFVSFGAQPRLAIITRTLVSLVVDLLHFLVVFIPSFLVYATSATLMFGRRMEGFVNFQATLGSTFRMCVEGEYAWEDFKVDYYWTSAIWIWSFIVFIVLLKMQLVIAIILDLYNEARGNAASAEAVWDTLGQFWMQFLNLKQWVKERNIVKRLKETGTPEVMMREEAEQIFPNMPECQMNLIFSESKKEMEALGEEDLNDRSLLMMAGSLMKSVDTVNQHLGVICGEESSDPLSSWIFGVKKDPDEGASCRSTNFLTVPLTVKGGNGTKFTSPDEVPPFNMEVTKWTPGWLKEVYQMLESQRKWLDLANWQIDQLQWHIQHAHNSKVSADNEAGVTLEGKCL
eukprot:TRINITY_DN27223_c0_g1_i1.p1 TRINITY_DN27223_c0_g1~~TRINITY_DN27223_c0_g1_i1.p1  ORF type:complete len:813 (-),score=116.55 TRINITY_DN27223_c0_g1_i1:52-2490(-)